MPRFEDLFNSKMSEARENAARLQQQRELDQQQRAARVDDFTSRLIEKFHNDPRYQKISSIILNSELQGAVNFMYSKLTNGSIHDRKPAFRIPELPAHDLEAVRLAAIKSQPIELDTFVWPHMEGTVTFDAGYQGGQGGRSGDDEYYSHGFSHKFRFLLSVKVNENGQTVFMTDATKNHAHVEMGKLGKQMAPEDRYVGWSNSKEDIELFNSMAWIQADSINDVLNHLATELPERIMRGY